MLILPLFDSKIKDKLFKYLFLFISMEKEALFELKRETFHILLGITIILMALLFTWINYLLFCLLIMGVILCLLSLKFKIPIIYFFLKNFERERFMKTFPGKGALFFIAGCLLVLKLFESDIALASIVILTFIDSIPPLIKISKIKRKRLVGTIVGGVLTFIAASLFVPLLLAAFGTIIGAISEAILLKSDKYGVDDNLIVPLVSGTLMMLFLRFVM